MKKIIVGNWKMNLNTKQSLTLVERLVTNIDKPSADIVLCPNFISLKSVAEKSQGTIFKVGAQNINDNDEGAYTGEISGPMLKGLAKYCIVGHSERRIHYGETDLLISKKVAACIRNGIIPILCVGENLHQREEKLANRTVIDQLEEDLSELIRKEVSKVIIAYEPVWAIGTGENAEPYVVEQMMLNIRKFLLNKYHAKTASAIRILYGGSVNADNAKSYLDTEHNNGLLVGGASLNYRQFSRICQL